MKTNRRRFLESAAANVAALAVMPAAAVAAIPAAATASDEASDDEWDLTWTSKLKGKQSAVFDCTDVENGAGVWRASMWKRQNVSVLKAPAADVVPVIVLRHDAIILAMQQSFWDKYDTGKKNKVNDPMTGKPTTKNPALSGDAEGDLTHEITAGAVALACNVAFEQCVDTVRSHEKLGKDEARAHAITYLVPGVILQPSGVFAVLHAQKAGAMYIKAS